MICDPTRVVRDARCTCPPSGPFNNLHAYIEILSAAWQAAHPHLPPSEAVIVIREVVDLETGYPESRIFIERRSDLELKYCGIPPNPSPMS